MARRPVPDRPLSDLHPPTDETGEQLNTAHDPKAMAPETGTASPGRSSAEHTLMDCAYSELYAEMYRTHWWWRAREHNVMNFIRRYVAYGGPKAEGHRAKVLDVGCGDGFLWGRLEEFAEVEGIEPDPVLIPADSPRRDRIEVADFLQGRARAADHDLVLMLDVLEHIEDERAALRRVAELLKDGGHLLLTVPALPALWSEFDELSGHFRRYTRESLRVALAGAGLTVVDLRYCYAWTVLPLFARKAFFKADTANQSHFVKAPARPINAALRAVSQAEHWLTRRVRVPFGSSFIAVATTSAGPAFREGGTSSRKAGKTRT